MMNLFKKNRMLFAGIAFCFLVSGCQKNSTFSETITFNGQVYYGHKDTTSDLIVADGVLSGATVICEGYSEAASTDASGKYSLTIGTVRRFTGENSDIYTIKAYSQNGGDEKAVIYARPGQNVKVKTLIVYKYTTEG